MCPLIIRKTPIVRFVRRHKQPEARCRMTPRKRVDLIGFFFKIRRLDHGRSQFWTWKSSRDADTQRYNRARWFHEWDSEWSDEDERDIGNNVVFTKISFSVTDVCNNLHKQSQRVYLSLSSFTMESWHKHRSSLRNERSGRKSRLQSERRKQLSLSCKAGPPEEWWDRAMGCSCYLRTVQDKMANDKTAFEEIYGQKFDRSSILFGMLIEVIPLYAKDRSRVHHFGKKSLNGDILGLCSMCGRRLVRRFDDSRLWIFARIRSLRNLGEKIQKPRCICEGENEFPSDRHWRQRYKISWRIQVGEMEDLRKSRILPELTVSGLELV